MSTLKRCEAEQIVRPQVAVVCLQYGARRAAEELREAGVESVIWLKADITQSEDFANTFAEVISPVVERLDDGESAAKVQEQMTHGLSRPSDTAVSISDECMDGADGHWLTNLTPPTIDPVNLDPSSADLKDLELLACDISEVDKVTEMLKEHRRVLLGSAAAASDVDDP